MSPIYMWYASTWTHSVGEAARLADASGIGCADERTATELLAMDGSFDGRAGTTHHGWLFAW